MKRILRDYIRTCDKLDADKYHALLTLFGKELVHEEFDYYLEEQIRNDFSFENQCCLWNRFGYYLATLNTSVFEKMAILNLSLKNDSRLFRDKRGGLSLNDEKRYGYHLLHRNYITICLDNKKNKVDMLKVFASIRHIEVRDLILKRFQYLYKTISRVSNYDKEMQEFLKEYQQLCKFCEIPYLSYRGELLEEDVLIEQVDMYVRYSVAKDKFIQANQDLLHNVCHQFGNEMYEDIISEGYLGLLKSIESFDIRKGYVFSTYATRGIKFLIWKYQNRCSKLIRLSANIDLSIYRLIQFDACFYKEYGRNPTEQEIALELGIKEVKVRELRYWMDQNDYSSLDRVVIKDDIYGDELRVLDIVLDKKVKVADEVIDKEYMRYIYDLIKNKLNERQQYVLLENMNGRTLKDISNELNISRERARQIEEDALKKLIRVPGVKDVNPFRE